MTGPLPVRTLQKSFAGAAANRFGPYRVEAQGTGDRRRRGWDPARRPRARTKLPRAARTVVAGLKSQRRLDNAVFPAEKGGHRTRVELYGGRGVFVGCSLR